MSEPVVQRQAVPDPQEALREQIAQALDGQSVGVYKSGMVQRTDIFTEDARRLADAVLPVVQAHTQALADENDRLREWKLATEHMKWPEEAHRLLAEKTAIRGQLASLRDAVSRLADEMDGEADLAQERALHLGPTAAHGLRGRAGALEDAARRLRSFLGDKEAQQ